MRKVKILLLAATVIGLFSLIGCTKNNNSTTVVKDSVYYSPWMSLSMAATDAGDTIYTGTINSSRLTQSIISSGAVLTYLGDPGYPNTGDTAAESAVEFGLYTTIVPGAIQVTTYGYLNDPSTAVSGFLFRYVIIPGTVLTTNGLTPLQARSLTYAEATKLINAPGAKAGTPIVQ